MTALSEAQRSTLTEQLEEQRKQLRADIREELLSTDNNQLAGQVHDAGEESVADLLVDMNVATISRHINELREVEAALKQISVGTYGSCEDCGDDIPFERLNAQPSARRCVTHQELHDKQFVGEKKPSL